ncbi:MAG TPA: hypothetical protein PKM59_14540 [Thermodesulfobacteriota bacterium]|nr:hypothetical protein [Deltaproteobacteria bacterium]HNR14521.1 hypothetical protein [Thermodesulfobacteriota bacterium]HNU71775.1 hypothetical protein [Thermodesulfobacteriota bacterium]
MNTSAITTKLTVVLEHWIEHNRGHQEEYAKWATAARSQGLTAVAEQIEAAAAQVQEADARLREALKSLEGN